WRFNDDEIFGATNRAFTLRNVQSANAGSYSVRVANDIDSVLSSNATLSVVQPPPCVSAPAGLVGWWPADGNPNNFAGNNDGAIINGVGYTQGKVGQGFNFTGSGAYIRVANSAELNLSNEL